MKDLFGQAILDYQTHNAPEDLVTETNISEADTMSVAYLFRDYKGMPSLEKKALQLAKGKILDVGCGAGSHSLYLQNKGFEVTAIDISPSAVAACRLRGESARPASGRRRSRVSPGPGKSAMPWALCSSLPA